MADDLTPLLDALRIKTTLFGIADLPRDWGVEFPPGRGAYFHVVYGGDGWLHLAGTPPLRVGSGEIVLLAHGTAHRITGTEEGLARVRFDAEQWQPNIIAGRRDATPSGMTLICAAVQTARRVRAPLLELMPRVFRVAEGDPGARTLDLAVTMLREEAASGLTGRQTVLARMGDVLLVQLVRAWLDQGDTVEDTWLAALRDPQIGPVLVAAHAKPGEPWTLASMAAVASLSRSRFAERFRGLLGVSPMGYVTQWRLDTARQLLEDGRSIRDVGRAVGYASEASFSRAFARHHGIAPSRVWPT